MVNRNTRGITTITSSSLRESMGMKTTQTEYRFSPKVEEKFCADWNLQEWPSSCVCWRRLSSLSGYYIFSQHLKLYLITSLSTERGTLGGLLLYLLPMFPLSLSLICLSSLRLFEYHTLCLLQQWSIIVYPCLVCCDSDLMVVNVFSQSTLHHSPPNNTSYIV